MHICVSTIVQSLSRIYQIVSHFLSSFFDASKRSFTTCAPSTGSTRISNPMASPTLPPEEPQRYQSVIVMRHGERIDNYVKSWLSEAARPWDPPLFEAGRERAFRTGMEFRTQLGFPIHRVFVSPFMRCVETAFEVVSALRAIGKIANALSGSAVPIEPPMIKTSVEYGLCEMFNDVAIRTPPEDGEWGFNLSEIKLKLPAGTVDPEYEPVFHELPNWGETKEDARARFEQVIRALADKYPYENLLLITHGEGLKATISTFLNGMRIGNVQYCAYVKLQRQITLNNNNSFDYGEFGVVSHHGYSLRNDGA